MGPDQLALLYWSSWSRPICFLIPDVVCLGRRLEAEGRVLAIGGDTVACDGLTKLEQNADVLVLSCYLAEAEVNVSGIVESEFFDY